jgi:hypothetical protein
MEAASRPPLELLPDLPVEAPVDTAQRSGAAAVPAAPGSPPAAAAGSAPPGKDPSQTGITFLDPESLVLQAGADEPPPPARAAPPPAAPEPELVLEDPAVVEELLTTPSPRPQPSLARLPPSWLPPTRRAQRRAYRSSGPLHFPPPRPRARPPSSPPRANAPRTLLHPGPRRFPPRDPRPHPHRRRQNQPRPRPRRNPRRMV